MYVSFAVMKQLILSILGCKGRPEHKNAWNLNRIPLRYRCDALLAWAMKPCESGHIIDTSISFLFMIKIYRSKTNQSDTFCLHALLIKQHPAFYMLLPARWYTLTDFLKPLTIYSSIHSLSCYTLCCLSFGWHLIRKNRNIYRISRIPKMAKDAQEAFCFTRLC